MPAQKSGRPWPSCRRPAAPSVAPALDGGTPVRRTPAPGSSLAREFARVFPLAGLRQQVLPAPRSPLAPPDSRRQTLLRAVLWPGLLRVAGRSPIPPFLPILPVRRASSRPPALPARREMFHSARAFPGRRGGPHARFPAAKDFPSEISRLFRQFSCALLQTIFPPPAPAVRSIPFLRAPYREVYPPLGGFLFPCSPFAPRSPRAPAPTARARSSPPRFPRRSAARAFEETPRAPNRAASVAAPAGPAPRPRQS